jgi:uncharacterized membrane protein YfcA
MDHLLPVLTVLFAAAFIRSAMGFGDALVAMPLLALFLDMRAATPLVALCGATLAALLLVRTWREVEIKAAWRLIVSTLVGIPIGLYYLKSAPEEVIKIILGVLLIGFGLHSLLVKAKLRLKTERLSYGFGFFAGALGGAYNTGGPPVVIYGTLRGWPPERFRATLQGYFLPCSLMVVSAHAAGGLWTPTVLGLYVYALPVIVVAVVAGQLVSRRLKPERFSRILYGCLIAMGALLVASMFLDL